MEWNGKESFPYAGITRIRSEGLISARNIGHPLTCSLQIDDKVNIKIINDKIKASFS